MRFHTSELKTINKRWDNNKYEIQRWWYLWKQITFLTYLDVVVLYVTRVTIVKYNFKIKTINSLQVPFPLELQMLLELFCWHLLAAFLKMSNNYYVTTIACISLYGIYSSSFCSTNQRFYTSATRYIIVALGNY